MKEVGATKDVGFEMGIRKTFAFPLEPTWNTVFSPAGMKILTECPVQLEEGVDFRADSGIHGTIRLVRPYSHIRMQWQSGGLIAPSTVQIRVLQAKTGTTISIHQEKLGNTSKREAMLKHWEAVINELSSLLTTTLHI